METPPSLVVGLVPPSPLYVGLVVISCREPLDRLPIFLSESGCLPVRVGDVDLAETKSAGARDKRTTARMLRCVIPADRNCEGAEIIWKRVFLVAVRPQRRFVVADEPRSFA